MLEVYGQNCGGGDFNVTIYPCESNKGGSVTSAMCRFAEVIADLGVRDMLLQGGPFTWSGGGNGRVMSRIDRLLVTGEWEIFFYGVIQSTLLRLVSNHFPILLDGGGIRSGSFPFGFESMWLKSEGFKDLLKGWWQRLSFRGSISYIMVAKLKGLKSIMKAWNNVVFGSVGTKKVEALRRVGY